VILGLLFDRRFSTVLIDEPEIGLSPRVQQALATILTEGQHRSDFFPHLEHVILATHSHLFLDRRAFSNNYVLARTGKEVTVRQIASPSEMHYLQFNMLGNSLEALSLPSAIVVVEGESDQTYLSRLLQLKWPNRRISVVRAGGDGEVLGKIHVLREALGDLPLGPYKDRLFVVLDARNSAKRSRLVAQGLSSDHIVTWSRNGIEYLYPTQGLAHVFRCRTDEVPQIALERDPIEFNGFRHSKKELAQRISEGLSAADVLDAELDAFLAKVEAAIT
jgi:hypothetical protein